jgi:enterochelin esterase-like enzyme
MKQAAFSIMVSAALWATSAPSLAQQGAAGNPEQLRIGLARPLVLEPDDVRAFAAAPPGFDDTRPGVAPGRVEAFTYESGVTGTRRTANVYLPAGYSSDRKYPVLYLLHGIAGNHEEWRGYVRAHAILDNLIADGQAVPMIVVMPNGRALPDDRPPPADRMFTPDHVAAFARFERDLLDALIPAIDAKYSTVAGRRHRALAGLSMGGGQALNFGLTHLDTFAWVGGFSPAPTTRHGSQLLPDAAAAREVGLLYLSCGRQDGLINVSQTLHRYLKRQGIAHVWNVDEHGHDRESWADNLHHFARKIFR